MSLAKAGAATVRSATLAAPAVFVKDVVIDIVPKPPIGPKPKKFHAPDNSVSREPPKGRHPEVSLSWCSATWLS